MKPEKKKRRRRSTFATALAQAKSRLQKAQQELEAAQKLVAALSVEIPILRHTAEALERQVAPPVDRVVHFNSKTGVETPPIGRIIPDADLTGIGGELTEDQLLPEPDGTDLLPEN